ncbi:protein ROOT PRIMORDIUM DEFECTIVE 1 [Panicum miliaceum]|uniref:Protein ROOT PRIMORDIUM DEFECTIVE 1 n=1 Tax=Panicum miliaceum TaxID=4540 RepID=A0A3L6SAX2_PANMI|nr:protein ROOT PRIMORDIUM DEFECTIVE 1 [Panicum miliaceum]
MRATCSRNRLSELLRCRGQGQWQFQCPYQLSPARGMTRGRSVKERSKKKRVHALEVGIERWKVLSKVLTVVEALKKEEEHVTPLKRLEILRPQLGLVKPHKVAHFVRRSPHLFEVCRDSRGVMWAGLSPQAEALVEEESRLLEEHSPTAAQYVTRMLMMSVDRRLPIDKIAHFRRDMGLPHDFRTRWVHMFPEQFRVVRLEDGEYLQLVSWNPNWTVTELEKKAAASAGDANASPPGELSLPFPMKFPPNFTSYYRFRGKAHHYVKTGNTEQFQKITYLSPYAEAKGLTPGTPEFDKRAVAVMHEILSFMLEKRLVTDHLTHFRREFVMPQKLMRLLLKHYGIFYVSERGKRLSVFLTEAYDGTELIEKCSLVRWREKLLQLTGYRGRMKNIGKFDAFSDSEDYLLGGDDDAVLDIESENSDDILDGCSISDDSEMDLGDTDELCRD